MYLINRLKTLYWFWKLTKDVQGGWIMERGKHLQNKNFMRLWNKKGEYVGFYGKGKYDDFFKKELK